MMRRFITRLLKTFPQQNFKIPEINKDFVLDGSRILSSFDMTLLSYINLEDFTFLLLFFGKTLEKLDGFVYFFKVGFCTRYFLQHAFQVEFLYYDISLNTLNSESLTYLAIILNYVIPDNSEDFIRGHTDVQDLGLVQFIYVTTTLFYYLGFFIFVFMRLISTGKCCRCLSSSPRLNSKLLACFKGSHIRDRCQGFPYHCKDVFNICQIVLIGFE